MKRSLSVIMVFAMLFSLAACSGHGGPIPTEQTVNAQTEAPTAEPTPEPTEVPTEAPTPEPTATPAPKELVFDECAELVCTLPWGTGENEVYFEDPNEDEGAVPQNFFIADGKVYIYDRFIYNDRSFIVYDIETGEVSRLHYGSDDGYKIWTRFAVLDEKLIGQKGYFDLETGEEFSLQPLIQNGSTEIENLRYFQIREGKLYGYVGYIQLYDEDLMTDLTEYELDFENGMWVPVRKILCSGGEEELIIKEGELHIKRGCYLGFDNEGNHYVQCYGAEGPIDNRTTYYSIMKYAPDGHLVSEVRFNYYADFEEGTKAGYAPDRFSLVTEDGTVWLMFPLNNGLRIYKLNLD